MIRHLQPGDVENIGRLFVELHSRSVYARAKPSIGTALHRVACLTGSPDGLVRVAEHAGKVTGIIACLCDEFWWAEPKVGAKFATDLVFYSKHRGDGALMLKEAIEWAWTRPRVICFETAVSSGIEHTSAAAMYQSAGLTLQGSFWRINHPNMEN